MKYSIRDEKSNLSNYLFEFKSLPLSFETIENFHTRKIQTLILSPVDDLQQYDFRFLFRYMIFPPKILNFFGEWQLYNRNMEVGDIIIQQANIPPFSFSIKLVFGVRILSVYQKKNKLGFSYGTLKGHPETGINEFSFYIEDNALFAEVNTIARPGLFLSQILAPVFTRPYVDFCNRQALQTMKDNFLIANQIGLD